VQRQTAYGLQLCFPNAVTVAFCRHCTSDLVFRPAVWRPNLLDLCQDSACPRGHHGGPAEAAACSRASRFASSGGLP